MISLVGLTIDGSRLYSAKSMASDTGDLAIQSVLTEYDRILKDVYGLFGISKTPQELEQNIRNYLNESLTGESYQSSDFLLNNSSNSRFVDLKLNSFRINPLESSELTSPLVMEKQIKEFMKYRGIISATDTFLLKIRGLKDLGHQSDAISAKVHFEEKLSDMQGILQKTGESVMRLNSNFLSNDKSNRLVDDYQTMITKLKGSLNEGIKNQLCAISFSTPLNITKTKDIPSIDYMEISNSILSKFEDTQKILFSLKNLSKSNFEGKTSFLLKLKHNSSYLNDVYKEVQIFEKSYKGYKDKNNYVLKNDLNKIDSEYQQVQTMKNEIITVFNNSKVIQKELSEQAILHFQNGKNELIKFLDMITNFHYETKNSIALLNKIQVQNKQVSNEKKVYKNEVEKLTATDIKSSLQNDFKDNFEIITPEEIQELILIFEQNNNMLEQLIKSVKSIVFYSKSLYILDSNEIISSIKKYNSGNSVHDVESEAKRLLTNNLNLTVHHNLKFTPLNEKNEFLQYLKKTTKLSPIENTVTETKKEMQNLVKKIPVTEIKKFQTNEELVSQLLPIDFLTNFISTQKEFPQADIISSELEITKHQKNVLSSLSSYISPISSLLDGMLDTLLIEEYMTEMFSCFTDQKDQLNLNGFALNQNNNIFFNNELEYILWGNDRIEKNVSSTMNLILGIRFLINCSYAFTSPEIRAVTSSMATSLAGWTVFGVPLIQSALTFAIALAESKIDLEELKKGNAVPLFKSSSTWKCSVSGMSSLVIQETQKFTNQQVSNLFQIIENFSYEKMDQFLYELDHYVNETIQSSIDTSTGIILNPIQSRITSLLSHPNNLIEADISNQIDIIFNSIKEEIESGTNGELKQVELLAFNHVDANYKLQIKNLLLQFNQVRNNVALDQTFKNLFSQISQSISSIVSNQLNKLGEGLKTQLSNSLANKEADIIKTINSSIDNFSHKMERYPVNEAPNNQTGMTNTPKGIAFTYKDYVKLFVTTKLLDETYKNEMLIRVSQLIQINISKGKSVEDNGKRFIKNPNFNLSKVYTFITLEAELGVKTNFFKISSKNKRRDITNLSNLDEQYQKVLINKIGGY